MKTQKIVTLLLTTIISISLCSSAEYRLPTNVLPELYDLWIKVNLNSFKFDGTVTITINVLTETKTIALNAKDITVAWSDVTLNQTSAVKPINFNYNETEEIASIVFADGIVPGKYNLVLKFNGDIRTDLKGLYKSSYGFGVDKKYLAVTHFEPTNARRVFPCFDEPAFRARFTIHIYHENKYNAISNQPVLSKVGPIVEQGNYMLTTFEKTLSMPIYLVAFVVSDFESLPSSDLKYHIFTPPGLTEAAKFSLESAPKALNWFTTYLSHPYILSKCDFIAIPDFEMGAMENWGLITFRAIYLLHENEQKSARYHQTGLQLITHELAHMWFGNEISPEWWNSLWLSEGFARFFEYYTTQIIQPTWVTWDFFQVNNLQSALSQDDNPNVRAIGGAIVKPEEIKFDYIVYAKAASIIRMFFEYFGANVFEAGLREYVKFETFTSVTPPAFYKNLQKSISDHNITLPHTVEKLFESWINEPGYPVVQADVDYEKGKIKLTQKRFFIDSENLKTSKAGKYIIPITVDTLSSNKLSPPTWFNNESIEISYTPNTKNNHLVQVNQHQLGYYRVNYNAEHWDNLIAILKENHKTFSEQSRAQLIDDSVNLARSGLLSYEKVFKLLSYLKDEVSFVPWATLNNALTFLTRILKGSAATTVFEKFIREISKKNYDAYKLKIGTKDHSERIHSLNSIYWSCYSGIPECITEAQQLFDSEYTNNLRQSRLIEEELESIVYCTLSKYIDKIPALGGSGSIFMHATRLFSKREANLEKIYKLITGGGCTTNNTNIDMMLDVTVMGYELTLFKIELTADDRKHIIVSLITGSYESTLRTIQFITNNYLSLDKFFESSVKRWTDVFNALGQHTLTVELLDLYDKFIKKNDQFGGMATGVREICLENFEKGKKNVEWRKANVPQIEGWLMKNVAETESDGASTIQLSYMSVIIAAALILRYFYSL